MRLIAPEDLSPDLTDRWERVCKRAASVEAELPASLEQSAARVLISSDFVLETLESCGGELLGRAASDRALSAAEIAAQAVPAGVGESAAMSALRKLRRVASVRPFGSK